MQAPECCGIIPSGHLNICGENGNPYTVCGFFPQQSVKFPNTSLSSARGSSLIFSL